MSIALEAAIAELQEELRPIEVEATRLKRLINEMSKQNGSPQPYPDVAQSSSATPMVLTKDKFYGVPLASAVREILQARKASGLGAATTDEIFEVLKRGGFAFEVQDDVVAKRGMGISLSKNTPVFHRIPATGAWGLSEWYPDAVKQKKARQRALDAGETVVDGSVVESPSRIKEEK